MQAYCLKGRTKREMKDASVRRQRLRHNQLMDTLVSCCILVKLPQSLVMLTSCL